MSQKEPGQAQQSAPAGQLLAHLYEVGRMIQEQDEPTDLLRRVLDLAMEFLGAERGMVLLRQEDGTLVAAAVRGVEDAVVKAATGYSHTAVREALAGKPVMALDVATDPRLSNLMSLSLHEIQSLVCVPLRLTDRILGVIYLDSRRHGAPFHSEDLRFLTAFAAQAALALDAAHLYRRLRRENRELTRQVHDRDHYEGLLGRSHDMQELYRLLDRAADSPFPALLHGETGTGKELAARALHRRSSRHGHPFLAVNCSAFSENLLESELFGHRRGAFTGAEVDRKGLFELAHGGSLFLDELGGMSPKMQAKLLRVLQDGEFRRLGDKRTRRADVRVIAATHENLEELVREGRFREDLYYRLNVIRIELPPLRSHSEDIPQLLNHFIQRALGDSSLPAPVIQAAAMRELTTWNWSGNVRELEHTAQKMVLYAKGDPIDRDLVRRLLPGHGRKIAGNEPAPSGFPSLKQMESRHILRTIEACRGDRDEAARRLGIGRATIYRKIRDYGLQVPHSPRRSRGRTP
ncbi:MAG: sigma-54-dependent Fis family transcriptional regulator [Acidobacteria bacterium]|nr:MAG: sigma-54-dependent Fis family transcriptional regulator [Acidobacteriota bacterium]